MVSYPKQFLKICWFLISEIKQTVSRMMCMKTHSCTPGSFATLDSHFEWFITPNAKLMFALGTSKVHATSTRQGVFEFASWTFHSMLV